MKWVFCTFFCLLSVSLSAYSVKVVNIYDPNALDPNTFDPNAFDLNTLDRNGLTQVMVGSHIPLVVYSETNSYWSGGFFIKGNDRAIGQLQARGKDPNSRDWSESHLPAAGSGAYVLGWKDSNLWGFDLYPDDFERYPGSWFVIDYYALEEGVCNVGFYDHSYSWTIPDPNITLLFSNTPTRDLNPDGIVNYADFSVFSSYWLAENCDDPNAACYRADFSRNGSVGLEDVIMFADFWLYGTPGWKPPQRNEADFAEPVTPDANELFNVTYAIVDTNSLPEITLQVGKSVQLYVIKSSQYDEDTNIFYTEVDISDPNMGTIDLDSAEILALPRIDGFDFIYSGENQIEGITFFAANIDSPILDGDMAGFVYTAAQSGDVTLNLTNHDTYDTNSRLESIKIHQVQPAAEILQQIYDESTDLQTQIPETEWNVFIESVQQSE